MASHSITFIQAFLRNILELSGVLSTFIKSGIICKTSGRLVYVKAVKREKFYFCFSMTLLVLSIISWIPYVIYDVQKPFSMVTFITAPLGMYFSYLCNSKALFFSNLITLFSFIPVAIIIYLMKGYIPI